MLVIALCGVTYSGAKREREDTEKI